ncbi:formylglycine-generating enzyme family protein [Balneola sp. MJW-20]|uniref:formylglycine-generating enzyme family protein n=1 Tax=Gracilimonas aurantiaca TaxID=3234185 RepID=UPI003466AFD0
MKQFLISLSSVIITGILVSSCAIFKKNPVKNQPEMVFIKGGTFMMGDVFAQQNTDALPVHEVSLDDFYLSRYEITLAQYDEYARVLGIDSLRDDNRGRATRAASYVTWDEADSYCRFFGYRLPTEEEWEYAARAGGKEWRYAGTNDLDSLKYYAVTNSTNIPYAYYVGSLKPNPLGLYDMSGNVFEWIGEYYQFYQDPENLHDLDRDKIRIIRGGSFNEERSTTLTYWRVGTLKDVRANDIGFRCADDG